MKKRILLLSSFVLLSALILIVTQDSETEKLQKKHAEILKNHPFNKRLELTKPQRKELGIPPNKYYEQEYLLEMNPNTGRTHPENIIQLQKELKALRKLQRVPGDASDNMWVERGPNNVGGRTRVVFFDPNDATHKRVFAGGVSGGLWVNNDITSSGTSWTRVGIDENLSVTCMTVDPNNSQIMYVGTGEASTSGDAVGNGVWKSTDGGTTWTNVFSDTFNVDSKNRLFYINDIVAWNNGGNTEVFVAVAGAYYSDGEQWLGYNLTGLYKSTDASSVVWNKVSLPAIPGETSPYEPNDIEIGADNTIWVGTERNVWGDGGGTVLKSTNGSSFTSVHTETNGRRVELAVSKQNANTIYALIQIRSTDVNNNVIAPYLKIRKTTNGFTSNSELTLPNDADNGISAEDFTRGQAWYDLVIEVDPTDDTKLYAGGIDLFRSINSGTNWKQISKWSNNNNLAAMNIPLVHADQHGWAFHPTDANKAVIGNDGGVYYATSLSGAESSSTAIVSRNKDYNVTQFYHGEIGQSTTNKLLLSGAQDNGTQFINGAGNGVNSSISMRGGDGAYTFIDKDGAYAIAAYVYNNYNRYNLPYTGSRVVISSEDGSATGSGLYTGSFINPADLDDNLDILYTNGATGPSNSRVGSIARFSSLTSIPFRFNLTNALLDDDATTLKVSPFTTTSTKLFVGTSTGKVLKVENANTGAPVWSNIGASIGVAGSVSNIAFGANENEIMVTFHNYGVNSVWFTTNGGTSWSNKEGNLPDIPVKAIIMNPLNNDEVIIGTGLGVWRTSNFKDASPTWTQSQNGMSDVKVTSFSLRTADNTVMATTYGRGMFTGQFATGVASVDDVLKDTKVFTMYPTVSEGSFTVFAKNTLGKSSLKMFDINGKLVHSQELDFTQQEKQPIQVNLNAGVYIVNLIDSNNKKATSKVIIK